jgi:uncharacterized protein YjbI with pentapeptide repeats
VEPEKKTPRERAADLVSLLFGWRPTQRALLWGIRLALVLVVLVAIGHAYNITLWDWLKLLIVPAAIAFAGLWFNAQQREREQKLARVHAQDEALQAYLDQMSQLLTDEKRPLHRAQPGDRLSLVARARTLAVLRRLDSSRRSSVLQFLYETNLIDKENPIVTLSGISILGSITGAADFSGVNLSFSYLGDADLSGTVLTGADLAFCGLSGVDLREADISEVEFTHTDLSGADLRYSVLTNTVFTGTILEDANLEGTQIWGNDLTEATLTNANLRGADFVGSTIAEMVGDDPSDSDLTDAILTDADLSGADLTDAEITEEQLAQCASLEGTIMPDGRILKGDDNPGGPTFGDWLKDRERRKEDGENN